MRTVAGLTIGCIAVWLCGCSRSDSAKPRSPGAASQPAREVVFPPTPDFDHPVDYFSWYSKRVFSPEWPVSSDVYKPLCGLSQEQLARIDPSETVTKQLREAVRRPWSAEEMPELAAYLASVDGPLSAYRKAGQVENVRWDLRSLAAKGTFEDLDPPTDVLRTLAKALLARAWLGPDRGGPAPEALIEAWGINFRCAHHNDPGFGLIRCLTGIGIRALNYESVRAATQRGLIQGEDLRRTLGMLVEKGQEPGVAEGIRTDAMFMFDLLERLYPNGSFSDAAAKQLGVAKYLPTGGAFLPKPDVTTKKVVEYYRPMVEVAEGPWSLNSLRQMETLGDRSERIARGNLILSTFLSSESTAYRLGLMMETERRGTILSVAARIYKESHGRWPASLDALELPSLPSTRIDPCSGQDFVYEVHDGQAWLYTVALDGQDDGGKHNRHWAWREAGGDYVFLPYQER